MLGNKFTRRLSYDKSSRIKSLNLR